MGLVLYKLLTRGGEIALIWSDLFTNHVYVKVVTNANLLSEHPQLRYWSVLV